MESFFPNLLCEENESSLKENKDETRVYFSVSDSDCEFIEMLFECETSFLPNNNDVHSISTEKCCFASLRSDVIKWFLQKMALFGYHYRTAYLSLIYFDRFLTRMKISDGKLLKIQILSIACFSLAAKMEECQVRPLRDYTIEGYKFLENSIMRMELIVLNTLEWRMCSVTPFTFLNYFAAKFYGECSDKRVIVRANELIIAIMKGKHLQDFVMAYLDNVCQVLRCIAAEIDVAEHRPSIIAAAVVLAARDHHLTRAALGSKMDAVPSWGSVEKECTISCYSLVQEIVESETSESVVSSNSNVVDDSSNTSRRVRRRLRFDSGHGDCKE